MKQRFLVWGLFLNLIMVFLISGAPAFADTFQRYITVGISYNGTPALGNVPVLITLNNSQLASLGYIDATGLNTGYQEGGVDKNFMVQQTRVAVMVESLLAGQTRNYQYELGVSPAKTSFPMMVGMGGFATISDSATIEPGASFTLEASGLFDTSAGANKYPFSKAGAIVTNVSSAGTLTTTVTTSVTIAPYSTTSDGQIVVSDATYTTAQAAATGTVTSNGNTLSVGQFATSTTQTQTAGSSGAYIYGSGSTDGSRMTENVAGFSGTITSVGLYLAKGGATGSPTGTAYVRVWASNGTVLGNIGSINVATLTGSAALYTFNSTPVTVSTPTNVFIGIDYTSGDFNNNLNVSYSATNVTSWGSQWWWYPNAQWQPYGSGDLKYIITYVTSFTVNRSFLYFDTSSIPVGATITAASLGLYGAVDNSSTDFNITVTNGQSTYPHDPLAAGDYNKTNYSGSGGTLTTAGYSVAGYNSLGLNATGISWINKGGTTKLALFSSRDLSITSPTGNEYVTFYATDNTGTDKDPYLTVTYTVNTDSVATGVTTGNHTVIIGLSGGTLTTTVDGVVKDTDSAPGTVADNASNWVIMSNNTSSYLSYFKITVGGVLKCWLEPATMVNGAFADRTGNGNNGTITWGANPAGVYITIGALSDAVAYVSGAGGSGSTPVVVGDPNLPVIEDTSATGEFSATGDRMPQYDIVNRAAQSYGMSASTMYGLMMFFVALVMFLGTAVATGSVMPGIMMGALTMGVGASTMLPPFWLAIFLLLFGVMVVYVLRRT